ncbi:MAG: hypothetical protein ACLR56_15300 [Oscillospiraceae bacterium]
MLATVSKFDGKTAFINQSGTICSAFCAKCLKRGCIGRGLITDNLHNTTLALWR